MPEIMISGIAIDVERKDIKNLHLAVHPPMGRVRIAAPEHMDEEAIRLFVISKLPWIRKHKIKFDEQQRQSEREYISGESHYFQGQRYLLNIINSDKNMVEVRNKKYIDLYIPNDTEPSKRKHVLHKWYKQQLHTQIPTYLNKWQMTMGIEASGYSIKQMKTKWGSCNVKKRQIWLNLELAKKPLHCLEYVILHELVHLLERNHNDTFISYMDKLMPQWRTYRDELNNFVLDHAVWKNA